jgi:hypothetical protein
MTAPTNIALDVATYSDALAAHDDFEALRAAEGPDLQVLAALVMSRDATGKVDVVSEGDGVTGGGVVLGGSVGLVVVDDVHLDPLDAALARAVTWISEAVDSGDDDKLGKALEKSEDQVYKAVER